MIYVSEIMTSQPYTLSAETSVSDAIKLMADKHIRHIPIVNEADELIGIVTHRDLLATTGQLDIENTSKDTLSNKPLADIMTTHVLTTEENAALISAAKLLEQHKFGSLPVVKNNKVTGIVTDSDFLAIAINLLEQLDITEPVEEF